MLRKFEMRFLRLIELLKLEGPVPVARRIYRKLRKDPPPPIICNIDLPLSNSRNDLHLELYGWAVSNKGSIERIEVFIDGKLLGEAEYGLDRPDVAAALPEFNLVQCGFAGLFLLYPGVTTEQRSLMVRVFDDKGNCAEMIRNILVQSKSELQIKVPVLDFLTAEKETLTPLSESAISVVIPTLNPGGELPVLLSALKAQEGIESIEMIIVDSGSQDQTITISREYGAKVIEVTPEEFSHSHTRNLGASQATGNYILFMTQDALPGSRHWLYEMISAAKKYKAVAVSCAETPRADVDLFSLVNSWHHNHFLELHNGDRVSRYPPPNDYEGYRKHCQLNNVACLIERQVFEKYKFRNDYAEDLDLGMRLANDGHILALLSATRVIHSHNRSAHYHLRRAYVDTFHMAKSFSNLPLMPYLELDALSKEVADTYRQLGLFVESIRSQIKLPCNVGMLLYLVNKAWNSTHKNGTPSDKIFQVCVDESYRAFINKTLGAFPINNEITIELEEDAITGFVKGTVLRITDYLQMVFESIDDQIFDEFCESIFKAHATATGMRLASYFIHESESTTEAAVKLQLDLKRGI